MKNFEKFLRYSRKLEELQTTRKAKEVEEIQKLDTHMDSHKCRELDQILNIDRLNTEEIDQDLEESLAIEQEISEKARQKLLDIEEFERRAQDMKINAPGNDFEIISEIQGLPSGDQPSDLKQLSSGSSGAFPDELGELTEIEFQRELQQNELAIHNKNDQVKEKRKGLFFFRAKKKE
jgi:hypothetical protein